MEIRSNAELERALHELQGLEKARAGSPEAKRRDDLDAAIKAYYAKHGKEIEKGKPREEAFDRPADEHPGET
jgi:hypothetical protein